MEVTAQMVKELRTRTGAGIMDCKEALKENEGNFEEAVRYLREKGLSSAAKKAGRAASEGQIYASLGEDGRMGVIVEVNCETDFVARTEDFQALLGTVADHVNDNGGDDLAEALKEVTTEAIAKLGENIVVARGERVVLGDNDSGKVVSYIHPGGRIGVLLDLRCETSEKAGDAALGETARDLAMHIAASSPQFLSEDQVPEVVLQSEREILLAQQKDSGKPENILEKIVEGRINKYKKEICLLDQPFVKDTDKTVQAYLKDRSAELGEEIRVSSWTRFQLGELAASDEG
ncbi:MAG: elongation factor Ts [Nitrospinae bacterium]|nr:elongation factor Ts [Nitrospinota bacterium]